MLNNKLCHTNFICKQAYEDENSLIVNAAVEILKDNDIVAVVGEDIILLVLMTALGQHNSNVYFMKPSKGKIEQKLYSCDSFKYLMICDYIFFLHALVVAIPHQHFLKWRGASLLNF